MGRWEGTGKRWGDGKGLVRDGEMGRGRGVRRNERECGHVSLQYR